MHKFILKSFNFIKNVIYFSKILAIFFLMLHLLYWIQNLTSGHYGWLQIFVPILKSLVEFGALVSNGSIDLFGAIFEYKYMVAVLIYVALYYICNYVLLSVENLENKYDDLRKHIKHTEEKNYNINLQHEQEEEESKINKYKIFVSTSLKKKFSHRELGYDLVEQNKIMNEFLIKKTGVAPILHNNGFLYEFDDFNKIDSILQYFFKLIKSNAPLDYVICVETVENNDIACIEEIDKLSSLRHTNKIASFADCVYRYKFNKGHRYGTSQLGLFQKGNDTMEVHEFIEI